MAPQPPQGPGQQQPDPTTQGQAPWWQRAALGAAADQQIPQTSDKGRLATQIGANFGKAIGAAMKPKPKPVTPAAAPPANPAAPTPSQDDAGPTVAANDIGSSGDLADAEFAADGKVFTKPTVVVMGEHQPEAAVPLGYRATAKTRPSMAMQPKGRSYYGG